MHMDVLPIWKQFGLKINLSQILFLKLISFLSSDLILIFFPIFSSFRLRKIDSAFLTIYDWKSLRVWLNSICMAQIKSFYIIRYESVMVWLNGCCLVSGCLCQLVTWIVCVCAGGNRQRAALHPFWPAPSGMLRKSSACAVGTVGTMGTTTKETVFAHWLDYCHYYASSVWCMLGCFHTLEKSDSCSVENSEGPPSPCLQQSGITGS